MPRKRHPPKTDGRKSVLPPPHNAYLAYLVGCHVVSGNHQDKLTQLDLPLSPEGLSPWGLGGWAASIPRPGLSLEQEEILTTPVRRFPMTDPGKLAGCRHNHIRIDPTNDVSTAGIASL